MPPVAAMSLTEKFTSVLWRTRPKLLGALGREFEALLQPETLAVMAAGLVLWAGSHAAGGVGFVCDALLVVGGVTLMGLQVWTAATALGSFLGRTANAQSEPDLEAAAGFLAQLLAIAGVFVLTLLVGKVVKKGLPKASGAVASAGRKLAGMLPEHFEAVRKVARQMNVIIAFRNTNPLAAQWIKLGFPGKPMSVKIKSSRTTGIVTAITAEEIAQAHAAGFFVVAEDGLARGKAGEVLPLNECSWPIERGQVVDAAMKKPLVGDYDLLGVIEPSAPGRNIVLVAENGNLVPNRTNPRVNSVIDAINKELDRPRVLHGAWDSFDEAAKAGEATVFFPDGTTLELTQPEQVAAWYKAIGRQSIILPTK